MTSYGLGRRAAKDERDHPMRTLLTPARQSLRRHRFWPAYHWRLNQGDYPECTEFAWSHFLLDSPKTHRLDELRAIFAPLAPLTHYDGDGIPGAGAFYHAEQQVDEWEGDDYDGTSVRAGAKVAQSLGLIGPYAWVQDESDLVDAVDTLGPVILGTDWPEGWFEPDEAGRLPRLSDAGATAGGHAYKVDGYNLDGSSSAYGRGVAYVRLKNQWRNPDGELWALKGFAYARLDDALELILHRDGEACRASEA